MEKENALKILRELRDKALFSERTALETFIPELKESEDEKIRKELITHCRNTRCVTEEGAERIAKWIDWLEKQGTPNQTSIWKHWKDGIAGNGEGKLIYLIKNGNDYHLSSCLGFECDYIELSELDKLMLEKQGEQKPNDRLAWSEGDETLLSSVINSLLIFEDSGASKMKIDWLKHIRKRIKGE